MVARKVGETEKERRSSRQKQTNSYTAMIWKGWHEKEHGKKFVNVDGWLKIENKGEGDILYK